MRSQLLKERECVMLDRKLYEQMKNVYGDVASWAVWRPAGETVKSNTDNMDWLNDNGLLDILNTGFIFVGLNLSSTHGGGSQRGRYAWGNFHSGYSRQNDYKLRFALSGTRYWGSYITDLIKEYPEVDSSKVKAYLRENPNVVKRNVACFEEEISLLGESPVLVALGTATHRLLVNCLGHKYTIVKILHYSYAIGKEEYRKAVLKILDKCP